MGEGKSSGAINYINENTEEKYIYITPYLEEIERVKEKSRGFIEPEINKKEKIYTKKESLKKLILEGKNIICTHALFDQNGKELKEWIKGKEYILIMDEVKEDIKIGELNKEIKNLRKKKREGKIEEGIETEEEQGEKINIEDIEIIREKLIKKDEYGIERWIGQEEYNGIFKGIKELIEEKDIIILGKENKGIKILINYPIEVYENFKKIYILTYQYKDQIERYYFDIYKKGIKYEGIKKEGDKYYFSEKVTKKEKETKEKEKIREYKGLINIYDGKLNNIGDKKIIQGKKIETNLSKNWYKEQQDIGGIQRLKQNTYNYFYHQVKGKSEENMWTTFKDYEEEIKGKGYTKGFLAKNSRATNKYKDRKNLAYLINIYINPELKEGLKEIGLEFNEEGYALSELLQWIFRSRIRTGERINIYIPSYRMRRLLKEWLNN